MAEKKTPNVAVLLGPDAFAFGDYYSQMVLHGLVRAAVDLGATFDLVIAPTLERIPQDLESCCRVGSYTTILAVGNAMQEPITASAKQFAKQRFCLIDGSVEGNANVISYTSNPREISFLCGRIAIWIGGSDATGCVLWSDNRVAREWISGFIAGARSLRKDAEVYYSFAVNAKEAKESATLQFKKGVGVIMCHAGSADLGIIKAAQENRRYVLGFLNERKIDPDHVLLDVVRKMDPIILDAVKRSSAGKFPGGELIKMGLKEGSFALDLKDVHERISDAEIKTIGRLTAQIKRGEFESHIGKLGEAPSLVSGTRV